MTGTHWLEESGFLDGPVMITNTHSVGVVRDAFIAWLVKNSARPEPTASLAAHLPVVAETYDGTLNDINGFHVKPADAMPRSIAPRRRRSRKATSAAARAWSATASRAASAPSSRELPRSRAATPSACWCSATRAPQLRIAGLPVGRRFRARSAATASRDRLDHRRGRHGRTAVPDQLKRLARRATLASPHRQLAGNGSGDILLAFSTANPGAAAAKAMTTSPCSPTIP